MTVCVLALDAADYRLAKNWDCNNLLLCRNREIETFSWSKDEPYTPEVWATVATGVSPAGHGIGHSKQELQWDNPLLRLGSKLTQGLPPKYRQQLGRPFREHGAKSTFQTINDGFDTAFDHTLSWPGLGEAPHLKRMWTLADDVTRGSTTKQDVQDEMKQLTGQELGYLATMQGNEYGVIGVHAHVLDIGGHFYCESPDELKKWYKWVDTQVGWLREQCEALVILSDHGMQTSYLDDNNPGSHSWRPYIASQGIDDKLPESVYDVKDYLIRNRPDIIRPDDDARMDTPTETLEELGYI